MGFLPRWFCPHISFQEWQVLFVTDLLHTLYAAVAEVRSAVCMIRAVAALIGQMMKMSAYRTRLAAQWAKKEKRKAKASSFSGLFVYSIS